MLLIKSAVNRMREKEANMAATITTRAKFRTWSVEDVGSENYPSRKVTLGAVTGEGSQENNHFWKATPAGQIVMQIDNPEAFDVFAPGQEFYVDFYSATAPDPTP